MIRRGTAIACASAAAALGACGSSGERPPINCEAVNPTKWEYATGVLDPQVLASALGTTEADVDRRAVVGDVTCSEGASVSEIYDTQHPVRIKIRGFGGRCVAVAFLTQSSEVQIDPSERFRDLTAVCLPVAQTSIDDGEVFNS